MDKFGFPGVLGCIDGTHIAIIRPTENEETYFNRKYYHSLNVLVICDADMRITYVNAGFGGASHDSHIWNSCPVLSHLQRLHSQGHQYWLLGDSAYAQRPWMMQPILNAERNTPEEYYTQVHVRTRNIVERCFGVLKTRWRCLLSHRVLHYDPVKAAKIVNACVVLHNLVVDKDIDVDFEEIARDRELQPARIAVPLEGGAEMRRAMVNRLWISRNR